MCVRVCRHVRPVNGEGISTSHGTDQGWTRFSAGQICVAGGQAHTDLLLFLNLLLGKGLAKGCDITCVFDVLVHLFAKIIQQEGRLAIDLPLHVCQVHTEHWCPGMGHDICAIASTLTENVDPVA